MDGPAVLTGRGTELLDQIRAGLRITVDDQDIDYLRSRTRQRDAMFRRETFNVVKLETAVSTRGIFRSQDPFLGPLSDRYWSHTQQGGNLVGCQIGFFTHSPA